MAKINTNQTKKAISVTLPIDIVEKVNLLVNLKKGMNVSKTISFILEDFFNRGGYKGFLDGLDNDDMLITIEKYSEIMGIGKAALASRIKKGEVNIVTIYEIDFIKLQKDDVLNLAAQILELKKQFRNINDILLGEQTSAKAFIELKKEINTIKKQISLLNNN